MGPFLVYHPIYTICGLNSSTITISSTTTVTVKPLLALQVNKRGKLKARDVVSSHLK